MSAFMRRLAGADPEVDPMVDAASVGGLAAEDIGWRGTAVVTDLGVLSRGTATSVSKGSTGIYRVGFDRDVSQCTYVASLGQPGNTGSAAGFATTATLNSDDTKVYVRTFDETGADSNEPFHLIVIC